jgi:hypothetical protein
MIYEADPMALNHLIVGRTLSEARALGPLVTPKQYRCSLCTTGVCNVVANTVQCLPTTNTCMLQVKSTREYH